MGLTVYGGGGKPEEEKTVTAGTSVIEVLPSSGKVMKKVTINPTPTESKEVTAGTSDTTVSPTEGKHLSGVTVHPTPSQEKTVIPTADGFKVSPETGKLLSAVFVDGDSDLVAENIKQGVNIFGVDGSFDNSHGAYVWAKYTKNPNLKVNINFSNPTYSYPDTWTFDISSSDEQFDVSDLTEDEFISKVLKGNANSAYAQVTFNANNTTTIWKSVYSRNYSGTYSYDNVNHKLTITNVESTYNVSWEYPTMEISVGGVFIDYVVNNNPNAYPNGDVHTDGYYYASIPLHPAVFGCSKVAVDKFTLSSLANIYNGYAVNHSLGKVPKIIFLCTNEPITYGYRCLRRYVQFPTSRGIAYAVVTNNNAGGDAVGGGTGGTAPTDSQVTIYERISSYEYLQAGIEYTLITMA